MKEHVKLLIIGSGPAGYTAAIYASRAGLQPVLYEGTMPGGQLTTTTVIENFPGFPEGRDANELMMDMRTQAERFGTEIRFGSAVKVDFSQRPFQVLFDDDTQVEAEAVILAMGATAKRLGLPDEARYIGSGVSTCATCDGFFYRGKTVAVVGGGDSALEEVLYLAGLAKKAYLIVRRNVLRASKVMQERVLGNSKIEVLFEQNVVGLSGEPTLKTLTLRNAKGEESTIDADGLFLAIGHKPNSELVTGQIDLDEEGYIRTNGIQTFTNVEGVFACGDVCDSRYRQAITAAASGCRAAIDAERWLLAQKG